MTQVAPHMTWTLIDFGAPPQRNATHPPAASAAPAAAAPATPGDVVALKYPTAAELDAMYQESRTAGRADGHAEGRAEGLEQGRSDGFAEGRRAGYAEGYEEGTARARTDAMNIHAVLQNLEQSRAQWNDEVAEELVQLALQVAREVLRQTLVMRPEAVLAVVREALGQLPHQHTLIYLHSDDASLVRSYLGEQLTHAGHRIFEDNSIERGGCRLEAAGCQIDASVATRWRKVVEALSANAEWVEERT
ncbi:MAG: flagellar assembly protein FliH [Rhodocyclaceae bacterium]|nr:flagellar assembly protein FliH [Rhodocyclaceae bacterium]MBX3668640.1 flagellar assembly protein FliH [Rhodocyclaceae bacterium]